MGEEKKTFSGLFPMKNQERYDLFPILSVACCDAVQIVASFFLASFSPLSVYIDCAESDQINKWSVWTTWEDTAQGRSPASA